MLDLANPYDKIGQVGADDAKLLKTIEGWVKSAARGIEISIGGD